ncbi:triose-phosphate isomerase [Raoultella planticola]|nr:triose-phosphate isomerase [Raoultella planticola]
MLKDVGAEYIIIGHSERRTTTTSLTSSSLRNSRSERTGLIPVLCIGETEAENEAGKTEEACARQIDAVLKTQGARHSKAWLSLYEPVWAIGTGKSATPAQAQAVHKFIRDHIAKADAKVAEQVIIQYGGSVNASNAAELFTQPDIDGALVGGASLKADAFAVIVKAAEAAKSVTCTSSWPRRRTAYRGEGIAQYEEPGQRAQAPHPAFMPLQFPNA